MRSLSLYPLFSVTQSRNVEEKRRGFLFSDYYPAFVTLFFFIASIANSKFYLFASSIFMTIGFIFPGMSHGSLDYHLLLKGSTLSSSRLKILFLYISTVLLGAGAWLISPPLILFLFLGNAAFHFGETDLRLNSAFDKLMQFIYGAALISFYFVSHPTETASYLRPFGLSFKSIDTTTLSYISGILFLTLFFISLKNCQLKSCFNLMFVLALGTQLPLVLAFGIYYILIHSTTAWKDVKNEFKSSTGYLIKKAAPFTLAGLLFIALAFFIFQQFEIYSDQHVPLIIIGLSAITLPHTLTMSFFYRISRH